MDQGGGVTEREWLACGDPDRMLDFLRESGKLSEAGLSITDLCWLVVKELVEDGDPCC